MAHARNLRESAIVRGLYVPLGLGLFQAVALNSYRTMFLTKTTGIAFIGDMTFLLAASAADLLVSFAVMYFALRRRPRPWSLPHAVPALGLAAGYLLCLTGIPSVWPEAVAEIVLGVVWAPAAFLIATCWVEVLSAEDSAIATGTQLVLALLVGGIFSTALDGLPRGVTATLGITALVVGTALLHNRRHTVAPPAEEEQPRGWFLELLKETAAPLLAFFVFELVTGMINMFAVARPDQFSMAHSSPVWGTIIAAVLFCVLILATSKMPSPDTTSRVLLPSAIAVLLLLPLLGQQLGKPLSTLIVGGHSLASLMAAYAYIRTSHDRRVSVYAVAGFASGAVRVFLLVGLGLGALFGTMLHGDNLMRITLLTVTAVYVLVLALAWVSHLAKKADEARARELRAQIEALAASAELQSGGLAASAAEADLDRRASALAATYHLTPRETDVLLLLGQGRSASYIGAHLVISESTVRGYIKTLYAKLGLHSKQEVVDLFH